VCVKPPLLGWIGFGIVAAVGGGPYHRRPCALAASRTNVPSTADLRRREGVLVLADATCSGVQLSESIIRHVHGRDVEVQVVAPTLPEPPITSRATKTRPTVPRRGDSGRRSSS
jgi:hypothetical protein